VPAGEDDAHNPTAVMDDRNAGVTGNHSRRELQALKERGKARAIGISVPDHRHDMVISLVESGLIDSVQTILNVFASEPLDTLMPICEANVEVDVPQTT
jgi:aryl-alcohol dehydrogenase-like predicted oxidoreductase